MNRKYGPKFGRRWRLHRTAGATFMRRLVVERADDGAGSDLAFTCRQYMRGARWYHVRRITELLRTDREARLPWPEHPLAARPRKSTR